MKKIAILFSLFLSVTMQAQDRPQPKPGPAPVINIGKPQTFQLPNGLKVLVVENHKLPRVSYNLTIDTPPYAEGNKKGVSDLASSMMGNATKKMTKDAFNEEIDFLGANINFSVNGAYASGLSKYSEKILGLMAEGALESVFTQEELDTERAKLLEGLKSNEKSVTAIAGRVENVLFYGKNHPSGEYLTEETINNVTLQDVINEYNTYFVPMNAYLIVIGDVKFDEVKKSVEKLFGSWKKAIAPKVTYNDPKDVQYTQINFIDMPNAVQSEISLVNVSNLKMTDKDYFAALLANQILGGDFNSYLNMNLREAHGWTYGARSSIRGNKYIGKFKSNTQVRNNVTDSAVVEFFKEIKKIREVKVTDEMLKTVKASYIGSFVMNMQSDGAIARYALLTQTQGLPANFYENYVKNINAVTVADIMKVSKKFFSEKNTRIVITGKGSEVLPALEKLGYPIFYFDKFGNSIAKPEVKKVDANVTVESVLNKYLTAIGGKSAAEKIKTLSQVGTATSAAIPAPLNYVSKTDVSGKYMMHLSMNGMSIMKQVLNGATGYMSQQGQKMDLDAATIAEMKSMSQPVKELEMLTKKDLKLNGIEKIDEQDAYVVVDGKSSSYYSVATGLKIADVVKAEGGESSMIYKNYKAVNGVMFPHTVLVNLGIEIEITISETKVNEGVSDADFQ